MAGRKRVTGKGLIQNWDEADAALRRLAEIERQRQGKENAMNGWINEVKEKYQQEVSPLLEETKQLEGELRRFCEERRADFEGAQSLKLHFGTVSFRRGRGITLHNTESTLAAIRKLYGPKATQFIRVKEELNREALEGMTDEELQTVGCSRKTKETFGYEIDWE
ncbi:MAG TPA: host-nuclease inhibitor Gam family protein, partial [Rhizobium sp.]|nr:host-nuclease inhibitor Gam family protein [Rhizobium sp.]